MAPRKRKSNHQVDSTKTTTGPQPDPPEPRKKRTTTVEKEQMICKNKLATLDKSESFSTEDRFTSAEKEQLIQAYNTCGFRVFQDMSLLQSFLPKRTESDLKGLLDRLRLSLQRDQSDDSDKLDTLAGWQRLCQEMVGKLARDAKTSMDHALADALLMVAEERCLSQRETTTQDPNGLNYPELLRSFAQLLTGKFPDNMTPANARASIQLFDHINNLVDGIERTSVAESIESGSWLEISKEERHIRQKMALEGLKELESMAKKCPTKRDLEQSRNIEALCLELPKIKRITELLNPLGINESLVNGLID